MSARPCQGFWLWCVGLLFVQLTCVLAAGNIYKQALRQRSCCYDGPTSHTWPGAPPPPNTRTYTRELFHHPTRTRVSVTRHQPQVACADPQNLLFMDDFVELTSVYTDTWLDKFCRVFCYPNGFLAPQQIASMCI